MRTPPFLARRILERLGADDEALIGDLVEEYRRGRSRAWYWAQVLSSVAMRSRHGVATNPGGALAALAAGWMLLLAFFFALGNPVVIALATRVFGWNRQWTNSGGFEVWWPFDVSATLVSYLGFALAAVALVRLNGGRWARMLALFACSVVLVQACFAAVARFSGPTRVPDTLFYVIAVGLPSRWYSGLLFTPAVILIAGLSGAGARRTMSRCTNST